MPYLVRRPSLPDLMSRASSFRGWVRALRILCLAPVVAFGWSSTASATPIASLPNLDFVAIFESTGTPPGQHNFAPAGAELTTQLPDPLGLGNFDFRGSAIEFYDVFYSDAAGTFDPAGTHVTVTAFFDAPGQSGGNVSAVALLFNDGSSVLANVVTAFVTQGALGVEAFPGLVTNAVDGSLATTTFLGQTQGTMARLSITVGFPSVPEPTAASLLGVALAVFAAVSRRHA